MSMAKCLKASEWTVRNLGGEGTVKCAEYHGRFRVRRDGVIKIVWQDGGAGSGEYGQVGRAALEAIEAAIRPRARLGSQMSKAGRRNAGG
jgi:hypothetical protein